MGQRGSREVTHSATWALIYLMGKSRGAIPKLLIGCFLLSFPFTIVEFWARAFRGQEYFTHTVFFAFIWLVFAPSFIWYGYRTIHRFLNRLEPLMKASDHAEIAARTEKVILSNRHLLFSLPIASGMALCAAIYSYYLAYPLGQAIWLASLLSFIGFFSGIGFWGVVSMGTLVQMLGDYDLDIDFSHPDEFGGLRFVGSLLVTITSLFFTGSLCIPFGIDLLHINNVPHLELLTWLIFGSFVGVGVVSFFISVGKIHELVFNSKIRIDKESEARLEALIKENILSNRDDLPSVLKPWIYYTTVHSRIGSMKEYPYDTRTILELLVSVLIPVVVFLLDKALR